MCEYIRDTGRVQSDNRFTDLRRRDDLETTVLTTEFTQTGIGCPQSLGPNCPISLRTTTQCTQTQSLTTVVPSGVDATFPTAVHDSITTETFGSNAQKISSSSGSPTSYVEPPLTSTSSSASSTGDDQMNSGSPGAACSTVVSVLSGLLVLVTLVTFAL
jgi:hypothetical protein